MSVDLSDMLEAENAILGPPNWSHDYHRCNCDANAPEEGEAYMSGPCRRNYEAAVTERTKRRVLLRNHDNAGKAGLAEEVTRLQNIIWRVRDLAMTVPIVPDELNKVLRGES